MACVAAKASAYLSQAGMTLPQTFPVFQVIHMPSVTADWLKLSPGFYNAGGVQGAMGIRIYPGNPAGAAPGAWIASGNQLASQRPQWCGQTTYPDLIPWGGSPMIFTVELTGITNIPSGSAFEFVVQGFDS